MSSDIIEIMSTASAWRSRGWIMLHFSSEKRIYVARASQDMRRGINSLSCVIEHELGLES